MLDAAAHDEDGDGDGDCDDDDDEPKMQCKAYFGTWPAERSTAHRRNVAPILPRIVSYTALLLPPSPRF